MDLDDTKAGPAFTAVKTGPIGHSMLLPTEQVGDYEALVDQVNRQFQPDTYTEQLLAQSIVDCEWRLRRVSKMEEGLLLLGRRELAGKFGSELDGQRREELIDSEVRVVHRKVFKTLAQQGRFLAKQLKAQTAELNQLVRENPRSKRRGLFLVPKRPRS